MPKLLNRFPKYRKHKASGQAVVTLNGHDVYLGSYGTNESRDEYNRVIDEWAANGRRTPATPGHSDITVVELVADFLRHADVYYRKPDGTPSGEAETYTYALRPLTRLYGRTPAVDFGPLKLKAVREEMLKAKWCRKTINSHVSRVKSVFKWAVSMEKIPASIYHGLQAVVGLKAGRTVAREGDPVTPVAEEVVEATLPYLSRQVKAMVELQLITGMRPGEVVAMRGADIDTTGKLWLYQPQRHKTEHHGIKRIITLGPKAQDIIKPFLRPELGAYLFSPAEALAEWNTARRRQRRTPLFPSAQLKRLHRDPTGGAGNRYDVNAYRHAVRSACDRAFPLSEELKIIELQIMNWNESFQQEHGRKPQFKDYPPELLTGNAKIQEYRHTRRWHPNQLRHTAATRLRKEYGLEAAQVILGHRTLTVTQVYAEKNIALAQEIMKKVG